MENNEKLEVAIKKGAGNVQIKNEQDYSGETNIAKVLMMTACVNVSNVNVLAGKVSVEGEIDYDILVVSDKNEILPVTQKSKFSGTLENEEIAENTTISVDAKLSELSSSGGGENLQLSSTIDLNVCLIQTESQIIPAKVPEEVFVRESEVNFNSLVADVKYDGVINFELPKDSKINKILFIKNSATIKSIIPAIDYFVASGTVFSSIIFETEEGQVRSIVKENNFSEEVEAKGTTKESNIQALIFTKEAIANENSDKNMFVFDVPIVLTAQAFNHNFTKTVVDAYSLKQEVNLTTQSFEVGEFFTTKQLDENILTNFTLSENIPQIDKLLATTPTFITVLNQLIKEGEVILEGVANINLVYYTEDNEGNNLLNSLDVEVPYSITFKFPDLNIGDFVEFQTVLGDVNVKVKHGRELEILAEVKVNVSQTRDASSAMTTEILMGEEKPEREHAMEIYLAKNSQTLWDIAKELNISTADLVEQNGEITLPLADGEKIVAYFKKDNENNK